jgi:ATP-binding cassette subfamily G (WHITE) protein 2 (PDR)
MGVITGDMLVNGKPLDASFARKTGYVQQQDVHLDTATVRESLRFSATLRQPKSVSLEEKYAYVEQVIDMLDMREFADAVVGQTGEGLNVEQRKLVSIGVELAAKPKLLLFLDEPTSGLDSQSSWAICAFLRKLADAGQAILCTVHQPSAVLFQQFDRLLFLARGGKTVYFGDIGRESRVLLSYFESHGSRTCGEMENPAEFMLEIVNEGVNQKGEEWHEVWNASEEKQLVLQEIDRIHAEKANEYEEDFGNEAHAEFAMPFSSQLWYVMHRVNQQYWRMPGYVFAKFILGIGAALFTGFSFFDPPNSMAGMQNVLFGVFMVLTIFQALVQQIQPLFVTQRALYEVRERPSKTYSWKAFMISAILVELPYQTITAVLIFACWYLPIMGIQASSRQVLVLLFTIQLLYFASSFAQMIIAAMPNVQTAAALVTLLILMSMIFCGVLQNVDALPGFWIFMYRLSPFTYWIAGMVGTQLHEREVICSDTEYSTFAPPSGMTCQEYTSEWWSQTHFLTRGYIENMNSTTECRYCPIFVADQYMATIDVSYDDRWMNFGIMWAFIGFNFSVAIFSYWFFRVRSSGGKKA